VLGGGLLSEDGQTRLGSVFIINVPNRKAAEVFSSEEPFRKAGLFHTTKITRMRRGQWHPRSRQERRGKLAPAFAYVRLPYRAVVGAASVTTSAHQFHLLLVCHIPSS